MGQQKNTITINGKTYDALSGVLMYSSPDNNLLVSDFINAPKTKIGHLPASQSSNSVKEISVRRLTTAPGSKTDSRSSKQRSAHHLAHHKPQKSITLKRSAATKHSPVANAKSLPLKGNDTITASAEKILLSNGNRYERAKSISKSSAIRRFGHNHEPVVSKQSLPLTVRPVPENHTSHQQSLPKADVSSASPSEDLFTAALSRADSHKQAPHKLSKRRHRVAKKLGVSTRAANIIAVVFVTAVLASVVAYQYAPSFSIRMAANQSGLATASLPSFRPSGFSLSRRVAASPGQIVLSFHSNSDDRTFTIAQVSSSWNSQTLADSFLAGKQAQRQDQANGKTIYLYGDSNATWVDGGIWYRLEGNSLLSTDQLLKIADSF